jgi:hypothetical protein
VQRCRAVAAVAGTGEHGDLVDERHAAIFTDPA